MAINWTTIYQKYKGEWVALKQDEQTVIAHGDNAAQVWREAVKKVKKPILMQVPDQLIPFVG